MLAESAADPKVQLRHGGAGQLQFRLGLRCGVARGVGVAGAVMRCRYVSGVFWKLFR